jgi:hypothetical protein
MSQDQHDLSDQVNANLLENIQLREYTDETIEQFLNDDELVGEVAAIARRLTEMLKN